MAIFFDPLVHVSVDQTLPKPTIPLDKSKAILDFFSGVHQFCAIKSVYRKHLISVNCLFFKQRICEKTGGKLCEIMHSIFDTPTRKIDVFSYGANFYDKTAAASYRYLILKVATWINTVIFPPLLQLPCDLQSQFTALNYMQRVAPANP